VKKSVNNQSLCLLTALFIVALFVLAGCGKSIKGSEEGKSLSVSYVELEVGRAPESIEAADFNTDGLMDLAVVGHGASDIRFFWGKKNREFELGPVLGEDLVGYHPGMARAVDWNGDGRKDLILAAEGLCQVQYWENAPSGWQLKASFKAPCAPVGLVVEDLDHDGHWDLVLGPYSGSSVYILWGKPEFQFDIQVLKAAPTPIYVHVADWNSDGWKDILWAEWDTGPVKLALNLKNREFRQQVLRVRPKRLDSPRSVTTADVDGDGAMDAIVPLETGLSALILYGDGKDSVREIKRITAPDWGFRWAAAVSAESDRPAMIALAEELRICVYFKSGDESWHYKELPAGSVPLDLNFVDMDRDGHLDLIFINQAESSAGVHYGPFINL
jgi:hypothetical protein